MIHGKLMMNMNPNVFVVLEGWGRVGNNDNLKNYLDHSFITSGKYLFVEKILLEIKLNILLDFLCSNPTQMQTSNEL